MMSGICSAVVELQTDLHSLPCRLLNPDEACANLPRVYVRDVQQLGQQPRLLLIHTKHQQGQRAATVTTHDPVYLLCVVQVRMC